MRNVSDKHCEENQNTYFVFNNYFFFFENILQPDISKTTVWRTRISCWITKATDTETEYVILIAFPQ